jgi:predicted PurR-regulated permease PerM
MPHSSRSGLYFQSFLLLLAAGLAFAIFWGFARPFGFALVLGIGFYPLHRRIHGWLRRPDAAALLSTVAVLVIFIVPAALLAYLLGGDMKKAAQYISDQSQQQGGFVPWISALVSRLLQWLGGYVNMENAGVRQAVAGLPAKLSSVLIAGGSALLGGLARSAGDAALAFIILYFVFRDGASAARSVVPLLPLSANQAQRLLSRARTSVEANLYGIVAVALAQGTLTWLGMLVIGIPSALVLGLAAAVGSLIPIVGTTLAWGPLAIYLLATGHVWKGAFLLGWGAGVISMADNVIRPLVLAGKVPLHPLLLLFALIGGVRQFGFLGLFLGPLVISLLPVLLEMVREQRSPETS